MDIHRWKDTLLEEKKLTYRTALRNVELECIQRLFEMEKTGFAGTGKPHQNACDTTADRVAEIRHSTAFLCYKAYRHRKRIMTAVQSRDKSLQDLIGVCIGVCNQAAADAGDDRRIDWSDVGSDAIDDTLFAILRQMNTEESLEKRQIRFIQPSPLDHVETPSRGEPAQLKSTGRLVER